MRRVFPCAVLLLCLPVVAAAADPFALFRQMQAREEIDPSHAFYLGYEMAKAVTALTLGKNYVQDQALLWGFLTRPEESHREGIA
jgi:hypothetical protein